MRKTIYFFEFIIIRLFFIICKLIGYKFSSNLGFFIGTKFGNFFRRKASIIQNLRNLELQLQPLMKNLQKMCSEIMEEF